MEWQHALRITLLIQAVLLVVLLLQIALIRVFNVGRDRRDRPRRKAFDAAVGSFARGGQVRPVVEAIRRLGRRKAVAALLWAATQVRQDGWDLLVHALSREAWVEAVRRNLAARRWWQRRECAHLLSVTAAPEDAPLVARLLRDPHPAVSLAIVPALERVDSPELTAAVLERLPHLSPVVLAYYAWTMQRSRARVAEPFRKALVEAEGPDVALLAEFGARLDDPLLEPCFLRLAEHPDPVVRARAAHALGRTAGPESARVLQRLALDQAWQVRLQAVRSLGQTGARSGLGVLGAALRDEEHWVRLRAGCALMRLGEEGRALLERSAAGDDEEARSVARLLLSLPPWTLEEVSA